MNHLGALTTEELRAHSISLITSLQTPEGAYPASPTFSAYRGYSWFRDGSFIADSMSAAGARDSAARFFGWCSDIIQRNSGNIAAAVEGAAAGTPVSPAHMLPTRFRFDGTIGTDEWWDFQLDGYGTWLWALAEHRRRYGASVEMHADSVRLTVDYLNASWRRPCFDWWEEHDENVHVSTLGCVVAGLRGAIRLGVLDGTTAIRTAETAQEIEDFIRQQGVSGGHLTKWIGSTAVDASLAALIAPLGVIEPGDPLAERTLAAIEQHLAVDRGVHRFAADTFYGGGQWPLLSCFAGLAQLALGNAHQARAYLEWAASTVRPNGDLPEQVDWHLLAPEYQDQWIAKWGTVATPLLWSHAMFVRLSGELG